MYMYIYEVHVDKHYYIVHVHNQAKDQHVHVYQVYSRTLLIRLLNNTESLPIQPGQISEVP